MKELKSIESFSSLELGLIVKTACFVLFAMTFRHLFESILKSLIIMPIMSSRCSLNFLSSQRVVVESSFWLGAVSVSIRKVFLFEDGSSFYWAWLRYF